MTKRKSGYAVGQSLTKKQRALNNKQKKYIDQAINMRVSGLVGLEKKYRDYVADDITANESLSATAFYWSEAESNTSRQTLTAMDVGSTHFQREGNEVTLDSLYVKGKVYSLISGASSQVIPQTVRMLVVMDHQNNNTGPPLISSVLDTSAMTIPQPDYSAVWTYRNLENIDRFTILHDETFDFNAWQSPFYGDSVPTTNAATKMINLQIKKGIKGTKIRYSSADDSDSNQTSNSIFCYLLVDDNALASQFPVVYFRGSARLRYYG